jgi:NAD+ synthase (glutamine-hydrolysing)
MALLIKKAEQEKVQVICFPELSVTGYTCADLFFQHQLLRDAEKAIQQLQEISFSTTAVIIAGMPVQSGSQLFIVVKVFLCYAKAQSPAKNQCFADFAASCKSIKIL